MIGLLAIGVAGVRLFRPIEIPGVQDCGAPAPYLLFDREEIPPPDADPFEDTEGCRDLAVDEVEQAVLAFGIGLGLAFVGAIMGLIDDRWLLHRAPRFESLLRQRPSDAPVALKAGSTSTTLAQGRSLPVLDPVDVLYLVLGVLAVFILFRFVAGGDVLDTTYEAAEWGHAVPAVIAAVCLPLVAAAQLSLVHRGLRFGTALEITLASSFRSEATPSLGVFGLAAYLLVHRGARRSRTIAELGGLTVASGAAHVALTVILTLTAAVLAVFIQIPDRWWQLVLIATASLCVGFFRGITPGGRLVQRPDLEALKALGGTLASDPLWGLGLVASVVALPIVAGLLLSFCAAWAGISVAIPTAIGICLVGQTALAFGPMPGGVGLIEAVLVWGLVGAGAPIPEAVLAVLGFRMLTYWFPMVLGVVVSLKLASEVLEPDA